MRTFSLTMLTIAIYLTVTNFVHTAGYAPNQNPISQPARPVISSIETSKPAANVLNVPVSSANMMVAAPLVMDIPGVDTTQLESFVASVTNGNAGQVVGVYAQDVLALPVIQQPVGQPNFVAVQDNTVTQFSSPSAYGAIGLLAHNFLSGKHFFDLKVNEDVIVVYGDGQQVTYRITKADSYQALDPASAYSNFVDVNDSTHTVITAAQLFSRVYTHPDTVVFQTCIDAYGNSSWGRLFVTAEKVNQ